MGGPPDAAADLQSFVNTGSVTAGSASWASALKVGGNIGDFTNSGTMSADRFNTVYIYGNVTGTFRNQTGGTIQGESDTTVTLVGTVNSFVNDGKIIQTSTFTDAAVFAGGLVSSFSNGGEITGDKLAVRLAVALGPRSIRVPSPLH